MEEARARALEGSQEGIMIDGQKLFTSYPK
jgi:hypothetical protein